MDKRFLQDHRSQQQRMLAGDHYLASDPQLIRDMDRAADLVAQFNAVPAQEHAARFAILERLFARIGDDSFIRPPFRCDYGSQISIGARTHVNWGLVAIDVARISIGDDVLIGPNVQLLTATHPIEPEPRRQKWESSKPITIADNVWLGGGVIVCPGVTIGANCVIGAGSVVVKDLPTNVVAVGNPARIIRSLQASEDRSGLETT